MARDRGPDIPVRSSRGSRATIVAATTRTGATTAEPAADLRIVKGWTMTLEQTQRVEVDSAGQTPGVVDGVAIAPDPAPAPQMPVGPQVFCFACGTQIDARAEVCPKCGVRQLIAMSAIRPTKDKVTAGILAILLGGLGIHKFYLGKTAQGVIYLLFFWTLIPAILGLVEGILYLVKSDQEWALEWGA